MIAVKNEEYRKLERDSSSLLMGWDGKWGLGWYEEAASAVLKAAKLRQRMAEISLDSEDWSQAAADALSSSACFVAATAPEMANEQLHVAQKLEAAGRIPRSRKDIFAALREREEEVRDLAVKANAWIEANSDLAYLQTVATTDRLSSLRQQIRELPGLALLHYGIFKVGCDLGQFELATKQLEWAIQFASDDRQRLLIQCALGSEFIARGTPDRARDLATAILANHPDCVPARELLAVAHRHMGHTEKALEVLQPLLDRSLPTDEISRVVALTVSAQYLHELGREAEFAELSKEIDQFDKSDPWIRSLIATYREAMLGTANGTAVAGSVPPSPRAEPSRILLCQSTRQLMNAA